MHINIKIDTLKKILILLLFVVVVVLLFLFSFGEFEKTSLPTNNTTNQVLRDEFDSLYLPEVKDSGEIVEYTLEAKESSIEIFDGYKTQVWAYNGTVPGPEIRVKLGDKLKVNFTNNLPQETTIHWHGVRVPNAMDGVPGVTQEPIPPGKSFTYEFTPKDAGTFWFHPHVRGSEQVERGLFGTLVVEDEYKNHYSKDVVWVLDDWRLTNDYQVDPRFLTMQDLMHDGRWGNIITVNGNTDETLNVNPGERTRLRLVNTSNARIYKLYLGEINAKIISVDGLYTKNPVDVNDFELSPGNRVDIDIKIPQNYKNQTIQLKDTFTGYTNLLGTIVVGNKSVATPEFNYPTNPNLPDWGSHTNIEADQTYVLDTTGGMGMMGRGMMGGGIEWSINGKVYPNYDPIELKFNKFNKIKFQNNSYRLHPMHLHGQFFKVLSRNGSNVNEPYFQDTVLIHPRETVEIGLVPLDKGEWASHCHILEHADAGMMTIISVK